MLAVTSSSTASIRSDHTDDGHAPVEVLWGLPVSVTPGHQRRSDHLSALLGVKAGGVQDPTIRVYDQAKMIPCIWFRLVWGYDGK